MLASSSGCEFRHVRTEKGAELKIFLDDIEQVGVP